MKKMVSLLMAMLLSFTFVVPVYAYDHLAAHEEVSIGSPRYKVIEAVYGV